MQNYDERIYRDGIRDAFISNGKVHYADDFCWCDPDVVFENPINGARVYLHRRADN